MRNYRIAGCLRPNSYGGLVVKGEIGIRLRMQSGDVGRSTIRGVELLDERIPSVRACQGRPEGPRRSRFVLDGPSHSEKEVLQEVDAGRRLPSRGRLPPRGRPVRRWLMPTISTATFDSRSKAVPLCSGRAWPASSYPAAFGSSRTPDHDALCVRGQVGNQGGRTNLDGGVLQPQSGAASCPPWKVADVSIALSPDPRVDVSIDVSIAPH